ncbi:arginine deiminase family protein [bacterium]|nr:arginine deiminase family protein [bacterium]
MQREKFMQLNVKNEYAPLKSVAYCSGLYSPSAKNYLSQDPEFHKFHSLKEVWDINLLVQQQEAFLELLHAYKVDLIEIEAKKNLPWQMYTRDVAFVVGEKLFYSQNRKFKERNGEFDQLANTFDQASIDQSQCIEITSGHIEGGDVMPTEDEVLVGLSSRTSQEAIDELALHDVDVKVLNLGENIMHLDTRLMILSKDKAVIHRASFKEQDVQYLQKKYTLIEVNDEEAKQLATNVVVLNPETIIVEQQQQRLRSELKQHGFKVETLSYSEPIKLGGSFRCTSLTLAREHV